MESQPVFPRHLYRGTAEFYDRYRPPYPAALFDDLCSRLPVSGTGRLLDLACGTGQVAIPLAGRFASVVAVDQEEQSVEFGRSRAEAAGQETIRWVVAAAEALEFDPGFELVTVGTAFHRLNRRVVADRMFSWLRAGGAAALLWSGTPSQGEAPWQQALTRLMATWMARVGSIERVPSGWEEAMRREPHEAVLVSAGFEYLGKFEFQRDEAWTLETLAGFMYSTSVLNLEALGSHVEQFEHDLAELVDSYGTDGVLVADASYAYQLARKPS